MAQTWINVWTKIWIEHLNINDSPIHHCLPSTCRNTRIMGIDVVCQVRGPSGVQVDVSLRLGSYGVMHKTQAIWLECFRRWLNYTCRHIFEEAETLMHCVKRELTRDDDEKLSREIDTLTNLFEEHEAPWTVLHVWQGVASFLQTTASSCEWSPRECNCILSAVTALRPHLESLDSNHFLDNNEYYLTEILTTSVRYRQAARLF